MLNEENTTTDELLSKAADVLRGECFESDEDGDAPPFDERAFVLVVEGADIEPDIFWPMPITGDRVVVASGYIESMAKSIRRAIGSDYSLELNERIIAPVPTGCCRVVTIYSRKSVIVHDWSPFSGLPYRQFLRANDPQSFLYSLWSLPRCLIPEGTDGTRIRLFQLRAADGYRRERTLPNARGFHEFLYQEFYGPRIRAFLEQCDVDGAVRIACSPPPGTVN